MWHSGRAIANASVFWRHGRHKVAAAPFAGPATFIWGQASGHRGLKASHGLFRPRRGESSRMAQSPKSHDYQDSLETDSLFTNHVNSSKLAEDTENDDPHKFSAPPAFSSRGAVDLTPLISEPRTPWEGHKPAALFDVSAPWEKEKPAILFDLSAPSAETIERRTGQVIHRLLGYSSDIETFKIYFEQGRRLAELSHGPRYMKLSKLYLRDVCQCSRCVCPSTGLKTFATCDILPYPRVLNPETDNIRLSAEGGLEITWKDDFLTGDNHTSVYSEKFLNVLAQDYGRAFPKVQPRVVHWDAEAYQRKMASGQITFHDWMDGGAEFAQAVKNLHTYGLVFMCGVPRSHESVRMIAEKLGHLQSTIHGLTWDVISGPGTGNEACASERLHQDLLYSHEQPQVQFIHCLKNDSLGNALLFSDGLSCAERLKLGNRGSYETLSSQLVSYNYRKAGQYLSSRRRVIQSNKRGPVGSATSIAWSPALQGPFSLRGHHEPGYSWVGEVPDDFMLRRWSSAARRFQDLLESPENVVKYRPRPGDCVIFDSRRILHGSKQLVTPAGRKHLRGACIDSQTLRGALVRLLEQGLLKRCPTGDVRGPLDPTIRSMFEEMEHASDDYVGRTSGDR